MTDGPLIRARGLCKHVRRRQAGRGADAISISTSPPARPWSSSASPASARARCCTSSARSIRPRAGEVDFAGVSLGQLGEAELAALRNREIGFIFQFHHLLPDFTALENTMMPGLISGLSWDDAAAPRPRRADPGRAGRAPGAQAGRAVRRRAAARRRGAGHRALAARRPRRRADRQPRSGHRRRGPSAAPGPQTGPRHHPGHRHAQSSSSRRSPTAPCA